MATCEDSGASKAASGLRSMLSNLAPASPKKVVTKSNAKSKGVLMILLSGDSSVD
jgi:hypothetical protein